MNNNYKSYTKVLFVSIGILAFMGTILRCAVKLRKVKKVSFFTAWYDMWVGLFVDNKKKIWYLCPLPCVVIKMEF